MVVNTTSLKKYALFSFVIFFFLGVLLLWGLQEVFYPYLEGFAASQWAQENRFFAVLFLVFLAFLPESIHAALSMGLVHFCVIRRFNLGYGALGFSRKALLRNITVGCVVGGILAVFYRILFAYFISVTACFDFSKLASSVTSLVTTILFTGFLSSFWQEVFFVGFMYSILKKGFKRSWAFVIVFFCFALIHLPNGKFFYSLPKHFLHLFVSVLLFEKTRSIVPSIMMHAMYNILV